MGCKPVRVKIKNEATCRRCGGVWTPSGKHTTEECPHCGALKDVRDRRGRAPIYRPTLDKWKADKSRAYKHAAASRALLRRRVLFRISGTIHPSCVRCGCDDTRLLEVNHKNGGGSYELRRTGGGMVRMYFDIALGRRGVEDLEVLCKPCNAIHALELKYGPLPMRVLWESPQSLEIPSSKAT